MIKSLLYAEFNWINHNHCWPSQWTKLTWLFLCFCETGWVNTHGGPFEALKLWCKLHSHRWVLFQMVLKRGGLVSLLIGTVAMPFKSRNVVSEMKSLLWWWVNEIEVEKTRGWCSSFNLMAEAVQWSWWSHNNSPKLTVSSLSNYADCTLHIYKTTKWQILWCFFWKDGIGMHAWHIYI